MKTLPVNKSGMEMCKKIITLEAYGSEAGVVRRTAFKAAISEKMK